MSSERFSGRPPLGAFFKPRNVAVIGATERAGSVGRAILANLSQTSFGGPVYAVNPKRTTVLGRPCYPSVEQIPEHVDLAVIVTPAPAVLDVVRQCVTAGVRAAIIITAGFRETGEAGARMERDILQEARRGRMRVIGPNCVGVMSPWNGLNATFAASMARPGHVALISQSGAICTAILDWSQRENVGFSSLVSVGSMLDLEWGSLIQHFGDDPHTRSIIIYMESIPDAGSFLSAAREVALSKPIIVLKPGRTESAAKAAASHTGALTGRDDVLDAAFRRCGVLRVNTVAEMFNLAEALDKQPRPLGPRLAMVTNAGGAAVLATDALIAEGGQLAKLSAETIQKLDAFLPKHWSHQNPVDILGDANAERYSDAIDAVLGDPATDGLLVILAPQAMTDPTEVARRLGPRLHLRGKPVLASWMGGKEIAAGEAVLNEARIPTYDYPDSAAKVFHAMWRYSASLDALYQTPEALDPADPSRVQAAELIASIRSKGRTQLTEVESQRILSAYGIPTVPTEVAASVDEAVSAAGRIGYPVVLKLFSETVTHKTDVGGVQLNLRDEKAVRQAYGSIADAVARATGAGHFLGVVVQPMVRLEGYELILGSSLDSQFGPVLLFGGGGQLVEVYKDRAIGLPPLTTTLARRMMEGTLIFKALGGVRGRRPVDLAALEKLLVRFSQLVVEQSWIKEIDINPLLASPEGFLALDARVILHSKDVAHPPAPAIRPYPAQYAWSWKFEDGDDVRIRPIRPEDEPLMVRFHKELSERSVYFRYFHLLNLTERVAHERLSRICFIDYKRTIALVAEHASEIIAVGRVTKVPEANEAELAVLIADKYQGRHLGTELWRRLVEVARAEGLDRVTADMLTGNRAMQEVCLFLGFQLEPEIDGVVRAVLDLSKYGASAAT